LHFAHRRAVEIEDLGDKLVEQLVQRWHRHMLFIQTWSICIEPTRSMAENSWRMYWLALKS
jgi:hypothetical protein